MYITFPADKKAKARLDTVCKSLNISLEEWFETALKASEFDVLVRFLGNAEDQTSWMWDEKLAYWLGNPVLNPATIIFMGFVLSWKFALLRIFAGIIMVFGIGYFANRWVSDEEIPEDFISDDHDDEEQGNLFKRWMRTLFSLIWDTIPAYFIVVLILGAVRAWLFPAIGAAWADSLLVVIGLAIAGTLFIIPTAGEIPIVQSLMAFGLGVGPGVALLMTLPAVSLPSLLMVRRVFPTKVLLFVTGSVAMVGHIFSTLFLGLAANLDNLGVGISYGVQKIRVPFLSNFFIAVLSGIVVAISVLTGHLLSRSIAVAGELGALMIVAIGIWVMVHKASTRNSLPAAIPVMKTYSVPIKALSCIVQITKNPSLADLDANGIISTKEAIALGITLSFNCIATGVGAGLTGMDPLSSGISVFIFSMISISTGYLIGWKTTSDLFEHLSQVISGVVLIIIGIYELLN